MGRKKPYNRRQWADESERCQEGSSKEKYDERKGTKIDMNDERKRLLY